MGEKMSLGEQNDWTAEWIRFEWNPVVPYLRKDFRITKKLVSARIKSTALGVYELWLNGNRVSNEVLQPGWTDYRKRVYYREYDLTEVLLAGKNVLGAIVAPGWYAGFVGPFEDKGFYGHDAWFSCELTLKYDDGTEEQVQSDSSWVGHTGATLSSDLLMGEKYDARKEIGDWTSPDYDLEVFGDIFTPAGEWGPAAIRDRPPEAKIEPYPGSPIVPVEELPAIHVSALPNERYVFDLGQNMVGVVRLKLNVPRDTHLLLRHGEMLNEDGTVYTENLRSAKAKDRYVAKGEKDETWQPRFTYHGFRYVQLEGHPGQPDLETVTGVVLSSVQKQTAFFECSDPRVNQLFSNIMWGFRGNYFDIPTDCPQRDERLGWTGDTQIFMKSAAYLADTRSFFDKWLQDLHDAQREDGAYPDTAPHLGRLGHGRAAWSDAGIICPYELWRMFGDIEPARKWWAEMCLYMEFLFTKDNTHNGPQAKTYGDWLNVDAETPDEFIGHAYRLYNCRLMKEMAQALGLTTNDHQFAELEARARTAFEEKYLDDKGHLLIKTQTAYALVVAMELLDEAFIRLAADDLAENLEANDGYLRTGFVGVSYLCPALTRSGRHDLAVQLLLNENYPSWLYEINNGATTIWERWNSFTKEDGFGDVGMNSFNHYAFGSVCEWMFESLAGINPAEPGFKTIDFKPYLTEKLDYVKASYESISGPVSMHWKKAGDGFEVELNTPVPTHIHLFSRDEMVEPGRHVFSFIPDKEGNLADR
jgi:alpha-L-rhamnosidase